MLIAIDGPAGSGKGTIAKMLAKKFNLVYLDTGKLYRAVALQALLEAGYNSNSNQTEIDINKISKIAIYSSKNLDSNLLNNPNLDGEFIGKFASIVSAIPEVRSNLIEFQRNIAKAPQGAVLDGRDIGTIICPNADYKFFITANLEARAKRRYEQLKSNPQITYQKVYDDIFNRDERDKARIIAPLARADDAILIDTSELSIDDVFNKICHKIK